MLGALEASIKAQRRLVADASHELRTPLSSLRTNIEVLIGGRSCLTTSATSCSPT
jgi:signal transduction histidine kinase